ncbi:nacht and ankyrin domain protein [Colletotrichum plurivorum]|uniref:Nacht and ankyrin domain protein n=1 Tax=Colletotrichum plurivorum TaxID=2175906 RepID=A0A8H6JXA9_9PEZI|nr:nacht and ankyrin domain protein [Colletotrichum plurivorum]
MFRNSRDSVPVPGLFDALTVFFGLTPRESAVFDHAHISNFEDRHGEGYRTSHPDPSRRIIEHQRRDFARFLTGDGLADIMGRFHGNLRSELARSLKSPTTQEQLPDLYTLVRNAVFRAEVEAIYGEAVFAVRPSFCEDFWAFYDAFPVVARGLPRWLFPSQYRARDRMLDNFRAWRSFCTSRLDLTDDDLVDCEYESVWGTRYVRRMVQRHEKMGFSDDGIASVMLGYLFVTTANTIPATAWMVLHALLDESLSRRMRQELSLHGLQRTSSAPDILQLSVAPLLNSVYRETLRLHVAGATGRAKAMPGLASHQSGSFAMTASWLGALDASFWNEGVVAAGGGPEHPVDSFWAERFLEYPDDPASGPVRSAKAAYARANISARGSTPKTSEDDSRARIVNTGLRGHWFPFGGGAWRCPGETLARATILTSVQVLLQDFEVDVIDLEGARKVSSTHRHRTLPFGTHAFASPVPIKVRKRVAEREDIP